MKKQITLCLAGAALLLGSQAMAMNPGVNYYSNEQTKAQTYANRMKFVAKAGKQHYKQVKKHLRRTNHAYNAAMKQERQYRRMIASETQYLETRNAFQPYPVEKFYYGENTGEARLVEIRK